MLGSLEIKIRYQKGVAANDLDRLLMQIQMMELHPSCVHLETPGVAALRARALPGAAARLDAARKEDWRAVSIAPRVFPGTSKQSRNMYSGHLKMSRKNTDIGDCHCHLARLCNVYFMGALWEFTVSRQPLVSSHFFPKRRGPSRFFPFGHPASAWRSEPLPWSSRPCSGPNARCGARRATAQRNR